MNRLSDYGRALADARVLPWLVGLVALAYVLSISHQGQVDLCARGLPDRALAIQADRDQAEFARAASAARRADGDLLVAMKYERIAERAEGRGRSRQRRMLGVDPTRLAALAQIADAPERVDVPAERREQAQRQVDALARPACQRATPLLALR